MLVPQQMSPQHERGYYIIWDTASWNKSRVSSTPVSPCHVFGDQNEPWLTVGSSQREFTIHYNDLDTSLAQPMAP